MTRPAGLKAARRGPVGGHGRVDTARGWGQARGLPPRPGAGAGPAAPGGAGSEGRGAFTRLLGSGGPPSQRPRVAAMMPPRTGDAGAGVSPSHAPPPHTPLGCGRLVAAGAALAGDSDSRRAAALGPRPVPRGDRAGPPPSGVVHGRGLQPAWKPAELIGFSQCKDRDETGHRVIISERSYFIMFDQFLARF